MFKKEPTYLEALTYSWHQVRSHKLLWLYGLFAAFLGQVGLMDLAMKMGFASSTYALYPSWLALPSILRPSVISQLGFTLEGWTWLAFVIVTLLAFGVFFVFVAIVSQGALIASVAQSTKRKAVPNVDKAWHTGVAHFWRLFFINVFKKISLVLLAVMIGWATLNAAVETTTSVGDMLMFFGVFILAVIVGLVVSFLAIYAAGYVVVEEYPLFTAIEEAWRLFLAHWLVSIEVGLVILFFNVLIGLVSFIALFVSILPTLVLWFVAIKMGSYLLVSIALLIGLFIFALFIIFLGSIFTVYTTSAWTYLFMKMHKHGMASRILRWLS